MQIDGALPHLLQHRLESVRHGSVNLHHYTSIQRSFQHSTNCWLCSILYNIARGNTTLPEKVSDWHGG